MLFSLLNTPAAAVRPVPGAPGPGAPAAARVPKAAHMSYAKGLPGPSSGRAAALSIACRGADLPVPVRQRHAGHRRDRPAGIPPGHRRGAPDKPTSYGIFPMILGSLYVTAGAIIVGVPIGLLTAVVHGAVLLAAARATVLLKRRWSCSWQASPRSSTASSAWCIIVPIGASASSAGQRQQHPVPAADPAGH